MKPKNTTNVGKLDVITGPMFAGKSEELLKRLKRYKVAGQGVKVFNHALDKRYAKSHIASHDREQWKAKGITDPEGILGLITNRTRVVMIDEVQFFPPSLITVIDGLLARGMHVVVAGLDTDFRGVPFPVTAALLAIADGEILKLRAVCHICKKWNATRSQRLLADGQPAPHDHPLIQVGAGESYQARCRRHHEVPNS